MLRSQAACLLLSEAPNLSISGLALSISVVVPFLNMTKQFAGNINQVSHQINAVVMGLAGAERIFSLIDEESEKDDGYVTLVNVIEENGEIVECTAYRNMGVETSPPLRRNCDIHQAQRGCTHV